MSLTAIITFAGGVGLLLLGMHLMSDGLKVAAGHRLRSVLSRGTTTRARAVCSGFAITSLVQSSSAVTFATIGFVNAGLLALPAAIGVIYGANLGTTVTSWLVALVGFKVELKLLALPAIAAGMALRIGFGPRRAGAFGQALAGFGVFFIGIDLLKEAFEGMDGLVQPVDAAGGAWRLLQFVGIGFLMTLVMQSSSATVAVALSAAATGLLPLPAAAAIVIGADVGTTSTAAFASIGATSAAKRTAAAHVLFNLVLAAVAIICLPLILWVLTPLEPATALAAFHTMTKLATLLLMWPLTRRMTAWLEGRFRSAEEDLGRPRHLDANVAGTPALALNALQRELQRADALARDLATAAVSSESSRDASIVPQRHALARLLSAIGEFTARQSRGQPNTDALVRCLRIAQYLADIGERAEEIERHAADAGAVNDAAVAESVASLNAAGVSTIRGEAAQAEFERNYADVKARMLQAGAEGRIPVRQMVASLDRMSALRRMVDQSVKSAANLAALQDEVTPPDASGAFGEQ